MVTATRGCGNRSAGGLYIEVPTSPNGKPLIDFVLDPAIRIGLEWEEEKGVRLSSLGVSMFWQELPDGRKVKHIVDVVGKTHYPNIADFLQETNEYGISRKLSSKIDLSGITKDSYLYMVHDKAWVNNVYEWVNKDLGYDGWTCIKNNSIHAPGTLPKEDCCCSGIWWQDLEPEGTTVIRNRFVSRKMPSLSYRGYLRPEGITPSYERGIFAIFPLAGANMAVIKGEGADTSRESAQKSGLPVKECED